MKLVFENYPEGEKLLQRVFAVATRILGIADTDWSVIVRVIPHRYMTHPDAEAEVWSLVTPKKEFWLTLSERVLKNKSKLLEAFCHELVHVKQTIRDGLIGDVQTNRLYWKGEAVDPFFLAIAKEHDPLFLPWEAEAYPKGKEIKAQVDKELGLKYTVRKAGV
jgi:hypothetical protein